jgi:hypothetical protein
MKATTMPQQLIKENQPLTAELPIPETNLEKKSMEENKARAIAELIKNWEQPIVTMDGQMREYKGYEFEQDADIKTRNISYKPIFMYNALANFIEAHKKNSQDEIDKLVILSTDLLTGNIMRDPVLVIFKAKNSYSDRGYTIGAVYCDKSTVTELKQKYEIFCCFELSELSKVIEYTRGELEQKLLEQKSRELGGRYAACPPPWQATPEQRLIQALRAFKELERKMKISPLELEPRRIISSSFWSSKEPAQGERSPLNLPSVI